MQHGTNWMNITVRSANHKRNEYLIRCCRLLLSDGGSLNERMWSLYHVTKAQISGKKINKYNVPVVIQLYQVPLCISALIRYLTLHVNINKTWFNPAKYISLMSSAYCSPSALYRNCIELLLTQTIQPAKEDFMKRTQETTCICHCMQNVLTK